jgi:carbamoyl-phosphate synthase large subunit
MNPRVSRSSALASKATGFPIAKIAAKLAVGYTLDEIKNDITRETPACFEPTIDYCVVKVPRFTFEKFPQADPTLTTQMKSVGEVMAIGRTFKESLQKAVQALELKPEGLNEILLEEHRLSYPNSQRLWHIAQAFREGRTVEELHRLTMITPWFLEQLYDIIQMEGEIRDADTIEKENLLRFKKTGFSDAAIAYWRGWGVKRVRELRWQLGVVPAVT